jgi:hypothetical protein
LISDNAVYLVFNNTFTGDNKAVTSTTWPNILGTAVYGGPTDLWGATWTPAQINDPGFGAALSVLKESNGNRTALVDTIQITVDYAFGSTTTVDCGGGSPVVTYGSSITCVATVTRAAGTSTPSGTVDWTTDGSGSFTPGSCTLSGTGGTSTCSVSYTPNAVGSGSHLISAIYCGDDNFTSSSANQAVSVNQHPITVTADAQSKAYGEADPVLTYQVTSGSLVAGDVFTGTLSRVAGETVGTYPILQGSLALTDDYNLTYVGADLTITQRPVTVTADAQSKAYGEVDPILTYQVTSGSLVAGDVFTGTLSRAAGEALGTYPILQGTLALSDDYDLTYVGADLTITQRPVTVTADAQSKAYGEADPILTYQVTSGSLLAGDVFTGTLSRAAGETVGTYPIQQGTLALSNYYDLAYIGDDLAIIKATPTISVTNSPVAYTGLPQEAVVVGSVDGVVSNILYDASSTAPSDAGTYAVTADFTPTDTTNYNSLTGASAGNFVISAAIPELTLVVTPTPDTFSLVGTVITFNFQLTNSGLVMLTGPFTVADDTATVTCPATVSLAPGSSITCTSSYTITPDDITAGFVTNTATGSGLFGGNPVVSNVAQATVNAFRLCLPPTFRTLKKRANSNIQSAGQVSAEQFKCVCFRLSTWRWTTRPFLANDQQVDTFKDLKDPTHGRGLGLLYRPDRVRSGQFRTVAGAIYVLPESRPAGPSTMIIIKCHDPARVLEEQAVGKEQRIL